MPWWLYPLLALGGMAAGAINTLAGGGSLIALPLLMLAGLDPSVANGTNRIGIAVQNVAAVMTFRRLGVGVRGLGTRLLIPSIVGAILGTWIAVSIDRETFRLVLGVIFLLMAAVVLVDQRRWLLPPDGEPRPIGPGMWLVFFALGIYGGFLQAGLGIFLMAALVLGVRLDLVRTNAVKVWLVLAYTLISLAIFAWYGLLDVRIGLVVAFGQAIGGALGARLTVAKGSPFVRWVLVAVVLVSACELLGLRAALVAAWEAGFGGFGGAGGGGAAP